MAPEVSSVASVLETPNLDREHESSVRRPRKRESLGRNFHYTLGPCWTWPTQAPGEDRRLSSSFCPVPPTPLQARGKAILAPEGCLTFLFDLRSHGSEVQLHLRP